MKIETLDRIFKFIYIWFLIVLVSYVLYMAVVLLISPKNDLKNRGFVGCTKKMVSNLGKCTSGQMSCVFKAFYKDSACNSGVIVSGFANWIKGNQSTPWSNYIFEPEWQEMSENPYLSNPEKDMEDMALEREFMLQKQQKLENIKNKALNVDESVIISDPESEIISEDVFEKVTEEITDDAEQNINDEAEIGEIGEGDIKAEKIEKLPETKIKSESEKIAKKAKKEVLKQGERNE